MIYFTTFIFTLLLSHIARAAPGCGDVASPQELYDIEQLPTYNVTWDHTFDNLDGNTDSVACSDGPHGLARFYPHFKDFPNFPYLGGAFDVKWGSPNCDQCWKLTNKKTHHSIYIRAIDAAETGFNIGVFAFNRLSGEMDLGGSDTLEAEAIPVDRRNCRF
jgi:hypothetical protein